VKGTPGRAPLLLDEVGTAAFVLLGVPAMVADDYAKFVFVPFTLVLAGIGVVGFVWSYFIAVERSRTVEISVTQLYLVTGDAAPKRVRTILRLMLAIQVVAGITYMSLGFANTKPEELNWSAVAIVAPLFGLGLNGVWLARHGEFGTRILKRPAAKPEQQPANAADESPDSPSGMEQNSQHG